MQTTSYRMLPWSVQSFGSKKVTKGGVKLHLYISGNTLYFRHCKLESGIIYLVQYNSKVMDTMAPRQTVPFIDTMLLYDHPSLFNIEKFPVSSRSTPQFS